jgi:DNA-binding transcriptional LysR family regulator
VSVTLTQLRSFLAVVRTGSVTQASDELVVTQPSVSAAVAGLSREVGAALLEREGRGVRPTAAGAAFAPFAADVIGLLERGTTTALEAAALAERRLTIAAVTTAAESFVPALVRAFAEAHPGVGLTLSVGNRGRVFAMVADHSADVAFAGRPPAEERIESVPVLTNELVLIGAPDDPLVGAAGVAPTDLEGRTWLLREAGSGTRTVNEEFLAAHGLDVPTLTMGSNGAIKQAARAGFGVSFLSRDAVDAELDAGLVAEIDVAGRPAARQWHMMRLTVGPPRPVVDDFVAFVRGEA